MTGTTTIPIEAYGERTVVTIVKDHYSNGNARYALMYDNKTDIDLGPTPSETDSWRDLIDSTMENTSCTKYVEISAIVGAMS